MIVIADSNIIFSALISPKGNIASILKERSNMQFIAPTYLLDEVFEHWDKIVEYSVLSVRELHKELYFYKAKIIFTELENIPKKHVVKAAQIIKDIDADDLDFIALYLHKKHKLWTGDKKLINGLKAKGYDICVTTAELKKLIYKRTGTK